MSYSFDNITVLVVEDNQPMLDITKSLLLTFGVGNVITAKDGDHGFRACLEHNPDIIIADWMMIPTDGIAMTKRIRSDRRSPNPYVPIILMTGFSEKRRVLQARDAGVTEFLVKPFTARDLYKRLCQVIERPRQFVRSEDFFGPDRRRKTTLEFSGPFRRESDQLRDRQRKARIEEAHETLRSMREKAGLSKGDKIVLDDDIDFA